MGDQLKMKESERKKGNFLLFGEGSNDEFVAFQTKEMSGNRRYSAFPFCFTNDPFLSFSIYDFVTDG